MKNNKISNAVIRRLPRYRRYLLELKRQNVEKISSKDLSELIGYTASQIRQDLNNFGGFGQQGYGYNIELLYNEINGILGLDKEYNMILIGAGNLGHAVTKYIKNYGEKFNLRAIFEVNEDLIGKKLEGITIRDDRDELEDYIKKENIEIAIICSNRESAQDVADKLCAAGIKGIWNFALADLVVPETVAVENVHLSDSLFALSYHMNDGKRA